MICFACNTRVDKGEKLSCMACKGNYHYACLNISASVYNANLRNIQGKWKCPSCSNITSRNRSGRGDETPTRSCLNTEFLDVDMSCDDLSEQTGQHYPVTEKSNISTNDDNKFDILREIRALRAELSSIKNDIHQVTTGIANLNDKFCEMETRFSAIEDRLTVTENKISLVSKLQVDLNIAKDTITSLQEQNNKNDQFARMNNLEISGIPITSGENLHTILHTIGSKVGIQIDDRDVDAIRRVRRFEVSDTSVSKTPTKNSRPSAIVVKFTRRICKDKLLAAVRARRGLTTVDVGISGPANNIYVSDHLTPQNKLLLRRARQVKSDLQYSYLWIRDCKILMRKNDHSKVIVISSQSDLSKLK